MYCTECIGAWWRATTVTAFVARSHTDALFEAMAGTIGFIDTDYQTAVLRKSGS